MFSSDTFDFAANGCLGKTIIGSTAGGLPLLLGFWVFESTSVINVEAVVVAVAADAVAGKSWKKPGKICWVWWI